MTHVTTTSNAEFGNKSDNNFTTYLIDEDTDDVVRIILIWSWWSSYQLFTFLFLKGSGKAGNDNKL